MSLREAAPAGAEKRQLENGAASGRIVLVSNRLPVSIRAARGGVETIPSSGGLATGLRGPHSRGSSLWIGWPGDTSGLDQNARRELDEKLTKLRVVPVYLSAGEARRFYEGFANGVLWPLLHDMLTRIPPHSRDWESYVRANARFADVVAEHAGEADQIWVHDYQLMLLPGLLRRRLPHARIGFFLHVPFPSSDIFRALPWRAQIIEGLLGADLIGFHTFAYARHFATSVLRILGLDTQGDRTSYAGRSVRLGVFPMGIDNGLFAELGADAGVIAESARIRETVPGSKILLGVDRLDYTKGIRRRLLAVERLLEREPALRGKLRFIQLAVPSREHVDEYQSFRSELEQLVGRINGAFATVDGSAPVHYLYRSVSTKQLVAMYRAADVMVVTPLRDGMNLVCKEFVASRADGDGVLVLSEMAGAADELGESILVNPYDVDGTSAALSRALTMPEPERRRRMAPMRERVLSRSVHDWATNFLATLEQQSAWTPVNDLRKRPDAIGEVAEQMASARDLSLLLDYDGTLVPIVAHPDLAAPASALLELLHELVRLPRLSVCIVSGRTRSTLNEWLGELPIVMFAEHGLWIRAAESDSWHTNLRVDNAWKEQVRPILEEFVARTPGSLIEEKSAGIVWHFRGTDPEFGLLQAKELHTHLLAVLAQEPVEILTGDKVLEIRPHGANKAAAVKHALERATQGTLLAAFGDDRTDEDVFAALPSGALSFHVGMRPTRATHRLADPLEVHALLKRLVELRRK